jgi:hypothetical protein
MRSKARIEKDKDGKGLWMIMDGIDGWEESGTAWAITHEEVKPIMEACKKYLEEYATNPGTTTTNHA